MGTDDADGCVQPTVITAQTSLVISGGADDCYSDRRWGAIAGFVGGRDEVIMRDKYFLTVPALVLAMAMATALGSGMVNAMIAISLVWWPGLHG
jgi:peptide/nickel transport system permease protein